ncbi:MAG: NAD-dependent epimerase/dehydratase family protein [Chloroflexi bacterium]|nr:NAD-dependent epimerase/dehydratase family protein [Chloroflexota bacterium]
MKVFLFGGTGFIGSRVVASLVRGGHTVSALARGQEKADFLRKLGATPHIGDLEQPQTIPEAIKGAEVIINAASPPFLGRFTMKRMAQEKQRFLIQMTTMLEAVVRVNQAPVIYTEGTMFRGDSGDGWLDETSPYKFDKGYGRVGEPRARYIQSMDEQYRLPLIKIMITGAYGNGSWFKQSVYDYMKKGWFRIFGDGKNVWSFVHVNDVAEAYRLAVEKLPIGQSFVLADDEPCTFLDFANLVAREMGKLPVKFFPKWVGGILAGGVTLEALTMNQKARNTKAKKELGWKLKYPTYKEGIPAVIRELEGQTSSSK